jgi:hypothetical protein
LARGYWQVGWGYANRSQACLEGAAPV